MIKILKFAKKSWYIMIFILLLLFVQANCELALPEYTSNIVDTGIQNGGIEHFIPNIIRESEWNKLFLFLKKQEKELVKQTYILLSKESLSEEEYHSYQKKYPLLEKENLYLLQTSLEEEEIENLSKILIPAQMMMIMLSSDGEEAVKMRENITAGMGLDRSKATDIFEVFSAMPEDAVQKIKEDINKDMSDSLKEQMSVSYIKGEYEAIGINLNSMQMNYLKVLGLKMLGISLLAMAVSVLVGFLSSRLAARTGRDLRNQVFQRVVSFSGAEMDKFSTASLITRSTNDIQQVQMVVVMIFRFVAYAPIIGIGGIVKVLNTNTSMTWIIAVAVAAILCVVGILMVVAMPKFKKMQTLVDKVNLVTREILTGIPVIRAFSREKYEEKRFDGASRELMTTQLFTNRAMTFMMPLMMLIMNGITVLILWVGAHGIDMGNLQVGDMMAFITYTMQIVMSFLMITMISIMLPRASVAAGRIDDILKTELVIKDPENPVSLEKEIKGAIKFENVAFRYPNAKEDVLSEISFTANPGETTAIIGSTGCGKSTLVQLIPRLYDVTKGSITIDGTDIRKMSQKQLREYIGFVPQKGILFSGTIASNLRFGAQKAADEEIAQAAKIAQAADFIEEKQEKYESPIAQGGTNVSGGQKQRLSIARAIAKEPKIYIFDDSFSALDYKTDIALRRALKEKVKNRTMIIVAQRISTILHAEKIIVLDEGKIAGIGTHQELLKTNEVYHQIAASQLSKEELEGKGVN